jgi:ribosomal protein S18 acetylase RimI-like enzyme
MVPAVQPDYKIRRATIADAAEVMVHRREMFRDMGYTDDVALNAMVATSLPQVQKLIAAEEYRGWLIESPEGSVVAGAGLHISHLLSHPTNPGDLRRAYVYNVYVAPEHRRKGLARRLMDEILAHCRAEGIRTVWLHASDEGRPLYDKMGFVATNEMRIVL